MQKKSEAGNIYGTLKIIGPALSSDGRLSWTCACQCGCGKIRIVKGSDLRRGRVSSCRERSLTEEEREKRSTQPRKCSLCRQMKPPIEFRRLTEHYCKTCRGRNTFRLQRAYGITGEQYESILESQNGVCAICGDPPTNTRVKYLHVDHDHGTGVVRGLLCNRCNRGIGYLRDSYELVVKASGYLKKFLK